jgi:hypothetical protein
MLSVLSSRRLTLAHATTQNQLLNDMVHEEATWWRICEVCLDVYSSIAVMLFKANKVDSQLPPNDWTPTLPPQDCTTGESGSILLMMIDVSRRLLILTTKFLAIFPIPPTVSLIFGLYQCHHFIGNLSCHILGSPLSQCFAEDEKILEMILAGINRAARHQKHLQPLVLALEDTLKPIRLHLHRDVEIS